MSDTQSEGRLSGEVTVDLLRAVGTGARVRRGITWPLGATLHGEGGLAPLVNVRVGAAVSGRSRAHGEVLAGTADLPPGREAVAGPGRFVGNLAAHQKWQRVAADRRAGRDSAAGNQQPRRHQPVWGRRRIDPAVSGTAPHGVGGSPAVAVDRRGLLRAVGPRPRSVEGLSYEGEEHVWFQDKKTKNGMNLIRLVKVGTFQICWFVSKQKHLWW